MAWTLLKWGGQTNPFLRHPNVRHSEQLDKAYRITGIASTLKQHTAQSVMSFRSGQELEPSHLKSYLQNKPKLSEITDIALPLISDRWLTLGRLLEVDEAFLETTIEAEDTNEKKCRHVLKWWLENCTSPSWSELLSVIEQTDPKQLILEKLRTLCTQQQPYNPHPPKYPKDDSSPNIYEVQRDVVDRVAAEWLKLGIVLQVELYVLKNITANSVQQGVEKCCMDLFMRWLMGVKGTGSLPRTWDTIIPAVEEIDPPLARELHSKYKTGCQKP